MYSIVNTFWADDDKNNLWETNAPTQIDYVYEIWQYKIIIKMIGKRGLFIKNMNKARNL